MGQDYEVERLMDRRIIDNNVEYLIKWKGFSEKDSTWEKEAYLKCPELLEEFENTFYHQNVPDKVIGATPLQDAIWFLMKWKDESKITWIPSREVKKKYPQILIKFYEEHLTFDHPSVCF